MKRNKDGHKVLCKVVFSMYLNLLYEGILL